MVKTVANIEGMMCGMCEAHMNDAIKGAFKVKKVESSHAKNETVIISDAAIDEAKLSAVVNEAGYVLKSVKSEPYQKKGFRLFGK
ncbi:MAG: hypothetical protein J6A83_01335 [Clostridia bacterium]|nr:hypothetical protein [Clostridia bacterium]